MINLTFGYSPCPNDTFAFHALTHGLVDSPISITPVLLDIEELNRRAMNAEFDLTKLSVGAFAEAASHYRLLKSGAAMGSGVGPLVVAKSALHLSQAVSAGKVAVPGRNTTAYRLLSLAIKQLAIEPSSVAMVEMRYNKILNAVASNEVQAGLIIHESRFTYTHHGLHKVVDLGEWWEQQTNMPVPLAGICAKKNLSNDVVLAVEKAIRESVQYAFDHPLASQPYVRQHAQEMSDDVCAQHIALYVNNYSLDIGEAGIKAIEKLVASDSRQLTF